MTDKDQALDELRALHAEVDREAASVAGRHGDRLQCMRGCDACCLDGLTVFELEAENIRRRHPEVLAQEPGPEGKCAFLDAEGACRVYADRPYICRTQGLPLRWFFETEEEEIEEQRSICELNVEGPPLDELGDEELWTIGPHELRLTHLQEAFADGGTRRVSLRGLFGSTAPARPGTDSVPG